MGVIEVDAVSSEPPEAGLTPLPDPARYLSRLPSLAGRPWGELGGDHDVVSVAKEPFTQKLFGASSCSYTGWCRCIRIDTVDFCGVEVGDSSVKSGVHDVHAGVSV
jgi:hypothetical protein